ncbi:hypothetical protein B0H17DRAFT_1127264 [Mycena rosella]|uniref:Uncharacterized protein n=1 Tax=Mycena rosella TaxID=1033263 RepID=A0AAD7E286_MYCRO|nr:hypothetical protein B0H17DRAFT_1127264 [Mycena rosella]
MFTALFFNWFPSRDAKRDASRIVCQSAGADAYGRRVGALVRRSPPARGREFGSRENRTGIARRRASHGEEELADAGAARLKPTEGRYGGRRKERAGWCCHRTASQTGMTARGFAGVPARAACGGARVEGRVGRAVGARLHGTAEEGGAPGWKEFFERPGRRPERRTSRARRKLMPRVQRKRRGSAGKGEIAQLSVSRRRREKKGHARGPQVAGEERRLGTFGLRRSSGRVEAGRGGCGSLGQVKFSDEVRRRAAVIAVLCSDFATAVHRVGGRPERRKGGSGSGQQGKGGRRRGHAPLIGRVLPRLGALRREGVRRAAAVANARTIGHQERDEGGELQEGGADAPRPLCLLPRRRGGT